VISAGVPNANLNSFDVGDINGDGHLDLALGGAGTNDWDGAAWFFLSDGAPLVSDATPRALLVETATSAIAGWDAAQLGAVVDIVPDLTGDGQADVAVGLPTYPVDAARPGALIVIPGTALQAQ
jgi:hypothetical protein